MAKEPVVVNGAIVTCTNASAPGTGSLIVLPSKAKADGQYVADVTKRVPIINVPSLGTCAIIASGSPGPCVPAIPGNWGPGASANKLNSIACVKEGDTAACAIGGTVSFNNAGQVDVSVE